MILAGALGTLIREQIEYRELLLQITRRDLLLRYKQTVMGFGWAILMPVINTAIFALVFTRVARVDTPVPYPLFAYSGFLFWNFLASSLRFSLSSLTNNANLVEKVYFPREILPFSAVLVCLVDTLVGSSLLLVMMLYYDCPLHLTALLLPVVMLVQLIFTSAIGLVLAMANLFYRDVKFLVEVVLTGWMFATSVAYPVDAVHGRLALLFVLNPMTQIIDAYRAVLLYGKMPSPLPFLATTCGATALLLMTWHVFHRAETAFAEHI